MPPAPLLHLSLLGFLLTQRCCARLAIVPRVLDDLATHRDLRQFTQLLRDDADARRILRHRELTIFAPTDAAFAEFRGGADANLLLYHMLPVALNLEQLATRAEQEAPTQCVAEQLPNLWLSGDGESLWVNDARVWANDSNHQSRSREDAYGKVQIMHKIDKVLSPMIAAVTSTTAPTAYDLLAQTTAWPAITYTLSSYYRRVIVTNSVPLYKDAAAGHTYLIPADEFRSPMDDAAITPRAIRCAIIPRVVFLHAATRSDAHRTLSRHCQLAFHAAARLVTSEEDAPGARALSVRVLVANVPLRNGVAHVVERMPGVRRARVAAVFPTRTLWELVNNDYDLQTQTRLLARVAAPPVQRMRAHHPRNLTLFVAHDEDWSRFAARSGASVDGLLAHGRLQQFMLRHVSDGVYDTRRLLEVTRTNLRGEMLRLGIGEEQIIVKVVEEQGDLIILWGLKRIRIVKADVKCSNGIVHVIDTPFILESELRRAGGFDMVQMWKFVTSVMY